MSAGLMLAMAMHPGTHPFNTIPYTGGVAYTPPPPPPPSTSPVPSPAYSPRKDPKLAWPWGRAVSGYEDASPTLGPSHHLSPTPPPPQQRVHSALSTPLKEQDLSDFFAKYDLLSTGGAPGKPRGDAGMKGVVPEKNQHEVDAPDWGAEPGDAASGRRPTRSTSRSGGFGAARSGGSAGSSSGGGRGSTPARRTRGRGAAGGGGDDDEGDGDDAEKGRGKDRLDIVEFSSGEESEEEEQSSDDPLDLVTPAKTQERPKGKGKAVSFAVGPAPPGKAEGAAPAAKRSRKDTDDDDEPAQRYFGPKKDRAGPFPPPSRRPGDEPPVPAQDRIAPWGETWWADRAPVFDFGETVFAQAYQSVQITADLARGKDGKRPQMADPESLPWTSRFGLPAPEDMPMMAAREKEFERDGVWDLQKALPILFDKDGSERTVEEVFPTYPDCNPQSNWKGKGRAQGRT